MRRGEQMRRLDGAISDVAYILDCLQALRNITETGNCNECGKKWECEYVPRPGQQVRYNCPHFERMVRIDEPDK